jgi:hypothetical protein
MPAIRFANRPGTQQNERARLERRDKRLAFVRAVGHYHRQILRILPPLREQESHRSGRSGVVAPPIGAVGESFERHLADPHHPPHVDDDLGMLHQEVEHFRVAIDDARWQPPVDAHVLDDILRSPAVLGRNLSPRNRSHGFIARRAAGGCRRVIGKCCQRQQANSGSASDDGK